MSVAAERPIPEPEAAVFAHVPDHVVYRAFPHETVVLNLQTGRYHGLNPTAGRILELFERGLSVSDTTDAVAEEFKRPRAEVQRDMQSFCADLHARGLIELSADGCR